MVPSGVGDGTARKGPQRQKQQAVPAQQGVGILLASSGLLPDPTCLHLPPLRDTGEGAPAPGAGFGLRGHLESSELFSSVSVHVKMLVWALVVPPAFPELQETVLQHLRVGIVSSSLPTPSQEVRILPICAAPAKMHWNHAVQHSNPSSVIY